MRPTLNYGKVLLVLLCFLAFLPLFSQTSPDEWKKRIIKDIALIGISAEDAAECTVSSSFTDASSNIQYAYLQQTYQQLRVFNNVITIAYRNGNFIYVSGRFTKNIRQLNFSAIPSIEAANALTISARHLNLRAPAALQTIKNRFKDERKIVFGAAGIAKRDIETELLWVQDDAGAVHLAWNVNIDVASSPDWWNVRVDARSGLVVNKDNWTVHERKPDVENKNATGKSGQQNMRSIPFFANSITKVRPNAGPLQSPPNVSSGSYLVVPFSIRKQVRRAGSYRK